MSKWRANQAGLVCGPRGTLFPRVHRSFGDRLHTELGLDALASSRRTSSAPSVPSPCGRSFRGTSSDGTGLRPRGRSTPPGRRRKEGARRALGTPYNFVEGTPATAKDSNTAGGALIRDTNGTDTNNANADWKFSSTLTPGGPNVYTP